jgi:hypothetical protein
MRPFQRFLAEVNRTLNEDEDEDDEITRVQRITPVVYGIASQGYNSVMHSTRGHSAQHHDAQLGIITATLAGSWASGDKSYNHAASLREKCRHQLPHKAFEKKIKNDKITRDLRLENVYYINVKRLRRDEQNGRYASLNKPLINVVVYITNYSLDELSSTILEKIIYPLTYAWNHSSLMDEIKPRVLLLKPEVYMQQMVHIS